MNEENTQPIKKKKRRGFLFDVIAGYLIGIAFIIPGFSGGSIAAIVGIYEKLINAVTGLLTDFKKSFKTLLPIGIGLVLGAVSLIKPLELALAYAPLPTVSLFVGLALGGTFSVTDKLKGRFKLTNLLALLIPLVASAGLCFIPTGADVNLFTINFGGYALLFLVGFLASMALVVPGISGSMLLLILGYYNPIILIITQHLFKFRDVGRSVLVLSVVALGICLGFITISMVMKWLLRVCPRGTYFAIVGFIVGSMPAAFISTAKEANMTLSTLPQSPWHWIACCLLFAAGFTAALLFIIKVKKLTSKTE